MPKEIHSSVGKGEGKWIWNRLITVCPTKLLPLRICGKQSLDPGEKSLPYHWENKGMSLIDSNSELCVNWN
jgi:hypothetical protein